MELASSEKYASGSEPLTTGNRSAVIGKGLKWLTLGFCLYLLRFVTSSVYGPHEVIDASGFDCTQYEALRPNVSKIIGERYNFLSSTTYRNSSAAILAGSVKIPTISYDDMGPVGADDRWDVFETLAEFLSRSFPKTHTTLDRTKVNTYGLLYTWQGSDASLQPILLMAHQDVVPVDSLNKWKFPPFSGHVDEDYVYGRGASDCKNVLIGILESIESLLHANFTPDRTILLAFGFDEEISGSQGALELSRVIESRYGKDGIMLVLDEGAGFTDYYGQIFATPGVAEKGYIDVTVQVTMPGGHSSVPPDHTAIGVLSELLVAIEDDPYPVILNKHNPLYQGIVCAARYAPKFPQILKGLLEKTKLKKLARELSRNLQYRYLMATSIAETVIYSGIKVNALPETATGVINHRISIDENAASVRAKVTRLSAKIAKRHDLQLLAFDAKDSVVNSIKLSQGIDTLDPAPITPLDTPEYKLLAGTIRSVFPSALVAPGMSSGNTDTKSMWNLSKHIFRFEPSLHGSLESDHTNIHTINERMSITGHVELVRFFYQFILNAQQSL